MFGTQRSKQIRRYAIVPVNVWEVGVSIAGVGEELQHVVFVVGFGEGYGRSLSLFFTC